MKEIKYKIGDFVLWNDWDKHNKIYYERSLMIILDINDSKVKVFRFLPKTNHIFKFMWINMFSITQFSQKYLKGWKLNENL